MAKNRRQSLIQEYQQKVINTYLHIRIFVDAAPTAPCTSPNSLPQRLESVPAPHQTVCRSVQRASLHLTKQFAVASREGPCTSPNSLPQRLESVPAPHQTVCCSVQRGSLHLTKQFAVASRECPCTSPNSLPQRLESGDWRCQITLQDLNHIYKPSQKPAAYIFFIFKMQSQKKMSQI